jgi:hypothetical protein
MPDRDDPNSPHATTPNINGRVARLEIDVEKIRVAQDYIPRLIDERLRSFEAGMAVQQKGLDQILLLIDQGRQNPDSSPIVREYREWRQGVEKRFADAIARFDEVDERFGEFQTRADRQDGVLSGLKYLGFGGLITALATLIALVVRIATMPGPVV